MRRWLRMGTRIRRSRIRMRPRFRAGLGRSFVGHACSFSLPAAGCECSWRRRGRCYVAAVNSDARPRISDIKVMSEKSLPRTEYI